jgi:hypothetical protein
MSLAKFVWLLQRSALFFSRSDLMGDPFEGHYSKVTAASEEAFVAAQMTDPLFASWGGRKFTAETSEKYFTMCRRNASIYS